MIIFINIITVQFNTSAAFQQFRSYFQENMGHECYFRIITMLVDFYLSYKYNAIERWHWFSAKSATESHITTVCICV